MAPKKEIVAKSIGAGGRKKLVVKPVSSPAAKPLSKKKEIAAAKLPGRKKAAFAAAADADADADNPLFLHNQESPYRCEILVKSAHRIPFPMGVPREERSKDYRHLVHLKVEPTTTIGALKSILEAYSWIPKENLVLVKEGGRTPLNDDNSILYGCGVKDHDTLLACTECGEYKFFIYHPKTWEFAVTAQSCFQTIGDVKGEIYKRIGLKPEAQVLTTYTDDAALEDGTTLVALGAVKPYLKEMENKLPCLKLLGPVHYPDELRGPFKRRYSLVSLDTDL